MKEIRSTVEHIKSSRGYNAFSYQEIKHIVDLAEKVLAVRKNVNFKEYVDNEHPEPFDDWDYVCKYVDEYVSLAITGALLNENELRHEITKEYYASDERATLLAEQIHSAQMEKLGGVR